MTDRYLLLLFSNHREILVEESNVQRVDSPVTVSVSLFNFWTCLMSDLNSVLTWCTLFSPCLKCTSNLVFHWLFSDLSIFTQLYNPDTVSV